MKPSTIKMDRDVFALWIEGKPVKDIMHEKGLTDHQVYKALDRERARRRLPGGWKPGRRIAKKSEKKRNAK